MAPNHLLHMSDQGLALDRFEDGAWHRVVDALFGDNEIEAATQKIAAALPEGAVICGILPNSEIRQITTQAEIVTDDGLASIIERETPLALKDVRCDTFEQGNDLHIAVVAAQTLDEAHNFAKSHTLPIDSFAALPGGAWGDSFARFGGTGDGGQDTPGPVGVYLKQSNTAAVALSATKTGSAPAVRLDTGTENAKAIAPTVVATQTAPAVAAPAAVEAPMPSPAPDPSAPPPAPGPAPAPAPKTAQTVQPTPKPKRKPKGYIGGKPKYLGLILTALLLLLMFAVGAWAATSGRTVIAQWLGMTSAPIAQTEEDPENSLMVPNVPEPTVAPRNARDGPVNILPPRIDPAPQTAAIAAGTDPLESAGDKEPDMTAADIAAALNALAQTPRTPELGAPLGLQTPELVSTPDTSSVPARSAEQSDGLASGVVALRVPVTDATPIAPFTVPDTQVSIPTRAALASPIVLSPQQRYARTGVWTFPPAALTGYAIPARSPTELTGTAPAPIRASVQPLVSQGIGPDPLPFHGETAAAPTAAPITAPYRPQITSRGDGVDADTQIPTVSGSEIAPLAVPRPIVRPGTPEPAPQPNEGSTVLALLAVMPDLSFASSDPAPETADAETAQPVSPDLQLAAAPDSVSPDDVTAPSDEQNAEDPIVQVAALVPTLRPQPRPGTDAPNDEAPVDTVAETDVETTPVLAFAAIRPTLRPADVVREARAAAQAAEQAAQRAAAEAAAAAERAAQPAPASALAVVRSPRPSLRPGNLRRQPTATAAAASTATATRASEVAAPTGRVSRTVASAATEENQIRLGRIALLGLAGSSGSRRAVVRLPNGSIERVRVGDSLDGGRVAAIGDTQLRYVKSGRNITLRLP